MPSNIGIWVGDSFIEYPIASPADVAAAIVASAYGIKGAVDTYALLPSPAALEDGVIYIVRDGTGAPGGANGLYWTQSHAWAFLDALNLQDSDEVVNKSSVTGAKVTDALNTLAGADNTKADLVSGATTDNFASLDAGGNIQDSGYNVSSFDAAGDAAGAVSGHEGTYAHGDIAHSNRAEIDKVTVGDHDVTSGNPHGTTAAEVGADAAGTAAGAVSGHESTYDHTLLGVSKIVATNMLDVAATVTKALLVVPAGLTSLLSLDVSAAAQVVAAAGESITVDVLKNGVTILSSAILIDSAVAAKTAVVGAISVSSLAVGDFLEVAYTYTAGGTPTPMSGIAVSFTFKGK